MKVWRKKHPVITGLVTLSVILCTLTILAVVLSSPSQPASKVASDSSPAATQKIIFDVPSLFGMDIDQIKKTLGTPSDDVEPTSAQLANMGQDSDWWKTFEKDGAKLLVTYNPRTRKVVDFFISDLGDQDKERIMAAGNLKNGDSAYQLEFVKALKDPSTYTGLKVTPASR